MNLIRTLTGNYVLNAGVVSWISAQVLKTLFTLLTTRRLVLERLVGAGGMPSSHSALACSIVVAMARKLGFASPEFGLALAFAGVVIYDAMGVRRAAGEHAKVLNRLVFEFPFPDFQKLLGVSKKDGEPDDPRGDGSDELEASPLLDKELKEFLGHTPFEVVGGSLLGILVAIFLPVV